MIWRDEIRKTVSINLMIKSLTWKSCENLGRSTSSNGFKIFFVAGVGVGIDDDYDVN